jgi:hypothetical protein
MVLPHFFRERLFPSDHQTARMAPGVGDLKQLEVADDVSVFPAIAIEILRQVEDHVGTKGFGRKLQGLQRVADPDRKHFMTEGLEGEQDFALGRPPPFLSAKTRCVCGGNKGRMHQE